MHRFTPGRPSPALIISVIALMVALGGTSYAAFSLPKNSVGTKQLKNRAVTSGKIKNGAVTSSKINTHGLTVPNATHANVADNATTLGGLPASAFAPRAFAKINSNGTVVTSRSKGITQSQISMVGSTGFCISGLSFTPLIAQATLTNFDVGEITADVAPNVGACPSGTQVRITTYNDAGSVAARGFSVFIY